VRGVLVYGGPPVGLVLAVVALILAAKALRRRRRRRTGTPGGRVAAGWREVLDVGRDLGVPVTARLTRREQAELLAAPGVRPLAERADALLFGAGPADAEMPDDYWVDVQRVRRDLLLGVGRRQRWKARVSLRSFRPIGLSRRRRRRRRPAFSSARVGAASAAGLATSSRTHSVRPVAGGGGGTNGGAGGTGGGATGRRGGGGTNPGPP
jgi:hypothetical protein